MRRNLVVLLVVGLIFGALAPAQAGKKKKPKPPPAPAAVDLTYNIGFSGETCVLSTTTDFNSDNSCGDPFAGGITGDASDGVPVVVPAVDGLPLALDATKPVKGTLQFGSYTLAALAGTPAGVGLGAGEVEWHIVLSGEAGGDSLTIGEVTTEAYTVAPGDGVHEVTFEFTPSGDVAGKTFDSLQFSFDQVGSSTLHGALITDGSFITLGAFK